MDTRQRIIEVTADLLQASPAAAVSTRDICEAAGITAPTLYHHFGDKAALYDAVATYGFESYLMTKRALAHSADPVEDLLHAWDAHVDFGVTHPALYTLMYGTARTGASTPAALEARAVLTGLLTNVAGVGRLRMDIDRAASVVEAACVGVTLQAIRNGYDPVVTAQLRETVIASVVMNPVGETRSHSLANAASELAARLGDRAVTDRALKPVEMALLNEWLRLLMATDADRPGR